jgi:hypothetical protein
MGCTIRTALGDDNAIRTVFGDSVSAFDFLGGRIPDVSRGQRFDSPAALVRGDFVCGPSANGAENRVGAAKFPWRMARKGVGREPATDLLRASRISPDQISVTAQTFTSTRPACKPISRTTLSSRSLFTSEDFLGQLTQSIPAGASNLLIRANSFSKCFPEVVNSIVKRAAA